MNFKIYYNYDNFKNDFKNSDKKISSYFIGHYENYLRSLKKIFVVYDEHYNVFEEKIESEYLELEDIKDLFNQYKIKYEDYINSNVLNKSICQLNGLKIFIEENSNLKKTIDKYLFFDFEDDKWWINTDYEKHLYLTETIILDLKNHYVGKSSIEEKENIEKSQIINDKVIIQENKDTFVNGLKFYYSFKEFETNYNSDFENWLKDFPDATEKDFLFEIKEQYQPFVKWSGNYRFDENVNVYGASNSNVYFDNLNITHYMELVIETIDEYITGIVVLDENGNKIKSENENYLDYWDVINRQFGDNNVTFDEKKHKYLKVFFNQDFLFGLSFNAKKYKNFSFSVVKIAEWIDEKINSKKIIQQNNKLDEKEKELEEINKKYEELARKVIEKDNDKTTNPKRLPAPIIIAMLKELGVFGIFNQKGFRRDSIIDTLYQIIGTDKTNLGKYYDSMNKDTKTDFNDSHIKKAKEFLNSKGF